MSKVTRIPNQPHRCEFPNCPEFSRDVGYAKSMDSYFCAPHRKVMLQAMSKLSQMEDKKKQEKADAGVLEQLQALNEKSERVFVLSKPLMDEVRGLITNQANLIEKLETELYELKNDRTSPPSVH